LRTRLIPQARYYDSRVATGKLSEHMSVEWQHLRVLIADDQRFILSLMFHMLKEIGVKSENIHQATNGDDAVHILRSLPVDLVVCDINMGPGSGLHLLKRIRTGQAGVKNHLPFIFLTAHSDAATVKLAAELDTNGFIVKPVAKKDLGNKLERVLANPRPPIEGKNYEAISVELSEAVKASAAMDGNQAARDAKTPSAPPASEPAARPAKKS
jgi:two-component system chemotaxis response regulator CheY